MGDRRDLAARFAPANLGLAPPVLLGAEMLLGTLLRAGALGMLQAL